MVNLTAIEGCCVGGVHYAAGDAISANLGDAGVLVARGEAAMAGAAPVGGTGSTRLVIGGKAVYTTGEPGSVLLHPGPHVVDDAALATLWAQRFVFSPDVAGL